MLRHFGSVATSVVLIGLLFIAVFAGTLAQAQWGAESVQTTLFSKVIFFVGGWPVPGLPLLFTLLGLNLLLGAWKHLPRRISSIGLWGVHFSVILFCFATLGFSLGQNELIVGIVPGSATDQAFERNTPDSSPVKLPFSLRVDEFEVETYPASVEPSDYVSRVHFLTGKEWQAGEIRMNSPLRLDGWTIYQSSVQSVEGVNSPVFKIVHSGWGWVPYALSGLLVMSLVAHLVWGRTRKVTHA